MMISFNNSRIFLFVWLFVLPARYMTVICILQVLTHPSIHLFIPGAAIALPEPTPRLCWGKKHPTFCPRINLLSLPLSLLAQSIMISIWVGKSEKKLRRRCIKTKSCAIWVLLWRIPEGFLILKTFRVCTSVVGCQYQSVFDGLLHPLKSCQNQTSFWDASKQHPSTTRFG